MCYTFYSKKYITKGAVWLTGVKQSSFHFIKKATEWNVVITGVISLLSIPGKMYTKVLQQRMKKYAEELLAEEHAEFRTGWSTVDQIFVIRQLAE